MRGVRDLTRLAAFVSGLVAASTLRASEVELPLASIERRVRAVHETVGPAVVRIVRMRDRELPFASGVIVTAEGHVVTPGNPTRGVRRGDSFAVHLPDGGRVRGEALGWSGERKIGWMKIAEEGPWPHVDLSRTANVVAGQPCVVLGYSPPSACVDGSLFDRQPGLRLGRVTRATVPIWPTRLADVSDLGSHGSVVLDLEGRLVGVIGDDAGDTSIELVKTDWANLAAGKSFDPLRLLSSERVPGESPGAIGPSSQVAAAIEKAKAATVRIRPSGEGKSWSGVIVSSDGYVATTSCSYFGRLPGETVTVHLPDGREAVGKILGSHTPARVSLVKITDKGPWPCVELGSPGAMRPDDPCLVIGYPGAHRDRQPLVRRTQIGEPEPHGQRVCSCHLWTVSSCRLNEADRGDGVFDLQGRLVAVWKGGHAPEGRGRHARVDLFRRLTPGHEGLLPGSRVGPGDLSGFRRPVNVVSFEPLGPVTAAFRRLAEGLPPIVVEVLGDEKPRALGTIVSSDGRVLTKASELYGPLSCRLTDGRVLPATVETVSREHDLAVLRIDASRLPAANWSRSERISAGTLIAAVVPHEPPLVGVVSQTARRIAPEPGSLGVGLRPTDHGLEVDDDEMARKLGVPIRKGEVIVHLEGRRTPDIETYRRLMQPETGNPIVCAGDPIRVGVSRDEETLELRFPLPATRWISPLFRPEDESRRSSGFASAFDTDIRLTPTLCGGPVIDTAGRVAGIVIACRADGSSYVIPATVAAKVAAD